MRWLAQLGLWSVASLAVSGCWSDPGKTPFEYFPDMAHSVPYDTFAPNPVFADGKTLQRPAVGAIPRGFLPFPYGPEPDEAERAGRELRNPIPADPQVMARGQHLYETFCLVCHGVTGQGDGPLIPKIPPPPAYTSRTVRGFSAGRLYHAVTWGSGRMPSYRVQINSDDRWRLVHYVQRLQQAEEIDP